MYFMKNTHPLLLSSISSCKSNSVPSDPIRRAPLHKIVSKSKLEKFSCWFWGQFIFNSSSSFLILIGMGFHCGTFINMASTACDAAILVSQLELRKYTSNLFNRLCNSWGCNRCTSPICFAAARRVTADDPDSRRIKSRSSLKLKYYLTLFNWCLNLFIYFFLRIINYLEVITFYWFPLN